MTEREFQSAIAELTRIEASTPRLAKLLTPVISSVISLFVLFMLGTRIGSVSNLEILLFGLLATIPGLAIDLWLINRKVRVMIKALKLLSADRD